MKANSLEELVTNSNIAGELRNYTDWHTRLVKFAQLVADWQKEQDEVEKNLKYFYGLDEGAKIMKEQMLKDAIPFYEILKAVPSFERENTRIIIVKEE